MHCQMKEVTRNKRGNGTTTCVEAKDGTIIMEKDKIGCWRLPFTKTASSIRRTTGFSVGCQTVYHVHLPSSINFQLTQGGVP